MSTDTNTNRLDLNAVRARLDSVQGREYWRSLEELAGTEEFQEFLHNEFPRQEVLWAGAMDRRSLLKVMGASLALAGLSGCVRQPLEKIVPYVRAPEQIVPGRPLFFATAMPLSGVGIGVLAESHEGRPTKIEGNPDHPASLGATDAFSQASVLTLYDPDRSRVVNHMGEISNWFAFVASLRTELDSRKADQGAGIRLLTGNITSPSLASQIDAFLKAYPGAKWYTWEPALADNIPAGARMAFGRPLNTCYRIDQADVILALDSDFLCSGPASVRYAREFANRRGTVDGSRPPLRLYAAEATPTNTGGIADNRLPVKFGDIERLARAIARQIEVPGAGDAAFPEHAKWINAVARDLQAHRGSSVVIAGPQQPPALHALAHAMNDALGNSGRTVIHTEPLEASPAGSIDAMRELAADMEAGRVNMLVVIGANPVYDAPADLRFAEQMSHVPLRIHLGLYLNETGLLSHWHVPEAHFLETWGDTRAFDGTATIMQPLIASLYGGKSPIEFMAAMLGQGDAAGHDIVRQFWQANPGGRSPQAQPGRPPSAQSAPAGDERAARAAFEAFWQKALHDGIVPNTALPEVQVSASAAAVSPAQPVGNQPAGQAAQHQAGGLDLIFRPDPTVYDGRFANNAWLQELPKPLTKITWGNAAYLSPATALRLELQTGDIVELRYAGRSLRAPAWVLPGHSNDSVTIHLGLGRTYAGKVGTNVGFNAYALRTSDRPWHGTGLELVKTGERQGFAATQHHHSIENRNLLRASTVDEYRRNPEFALEEADKKPRPTLYPQWQYPGYAWGMAIDLTRCTGCNSCVLACVAENNIPVVGRTEVMRGREMHWLRIDHYYQGDMDNPASYFQPVLCMHCENAPCEVVCPVAATAHSAEGLNDMVYNRCVGTRYCSNNCPYKVRRFNFLLYSDFDTPSLKLMRNPDVTVRSRGVMEKCSYCVQRINHARIQAEVEQRQVRDGEIVTACQQACPSQAIVFGNINDKGSAVAKRKADSRNYGMLADLNTQPRTTYLAALRNPNPELGGPSRGTATGHPEGGKE